MGKFGFFKKNKLTKRSKKNVCKMTYLYQLQQELEK